jgi:hypothetical protein
VIEVAAVGESGDGGGGGVSYEMRKGSTSEARRNRNLIAKFGRALKIGVD